MSKIDTRKLSTLGLLSALSVLLVMAKLPFTPAPFLEFDLADVPILIGTYKYGSKSGILITVVASAIQAMTVSAASGFIGFLMHVMATGAMCLAVGQLYKGEKTNKKLVIASIAGIVARTVVMVVLNIIITPIFMGVGVDEVLKMIVPIIIPFNLIQAGATSFVAAAIYKTLNIILDR